MCENLIAAGENIVRILTIRGLLYFVGDSGRFGRVDFGDWNLSVEGLDLYGFARDCWM